MDFSFTEEQSMLRDTVASYLADHYSFDQRKAALATQPGWSPAIWKAFAEELGILGAPFSEELGGLGGGPVENMIVMQEMGRALVVEPYLATVVIGGGSLSGGKGSVIGTLTGALLMSVVNTGCVKMELSSGLQLIVTGVIIIVAVLLDRLQNQKN